MNRIGVYMFRNEITNEKYIGSSEDALNRYKEHMKLLIKGEHGNYKFQEAFNKYGLENFAFIILELTYEESRFKKEKDYIIKYDSIKNGYNLCLPYSDVTPEEIYYIYHQINSINEIKNFAKKYKNYKYSVEFITSIVNGELPECKEMGLKKKFNTIVYSGSDEHVKDIYKRLANGATIKDIMMIYQNVSPSTIKNIRTGFHNACKRLNLEPIVLKDEFGEEIDHANRKISKSKILAVRQDYKNGIKVKDIAEKYNISPSSVRNVLTCHNKICRELNLEPLIVNK